MAWWILLLSLCFSAPAAFAQTAKDRAEIDQLLQSESSLSDLNSRLTFISESFVGRPYLKNGPLGEGVDGLYDQDPLYRTDGFDCTTFVETSIVLARSFQFDDFMNQLNHIRYQDGVIDFTRRNHFVEIDWNPNNEAAGFLKDITRSLAFNPAHLGESIQVISKRKWYEGMTTADLKLLQPTAALLAERLTQLKAEGSRFEDQDSTLPYLKKSTLKTSLTAAAAPAVLNILRDFKAGDGKITSFVSHQVLLVIKNGQPRVRQASSRSSTMKVIDQSLAEFIQQQMETENTRGINVLQIQNR